MGDVEQPKLLRTEVSGRPALIAYFDADYNLVLGADDGAVLAKVVFQDDAGGAIFFDLHKEGLADPELVEGDNDGEAAGRGGPDNAAQGTDQEAER